MSIVAKIHQHYENHPRRLKPPTGWPTGSRLGTCAAQLQLLRVPELSRPEPFRGRALRVFENGDRIEAWLGDLLNQVYPDVVGLRQEPFFMPVSLDAEQREILQRRIEQRSVWGRVMERFNEPKLSLGDDGRVKARLVPRKDDGKPVNYGFVLDLDRACVWVPTYIDFAVKHDTLGLTILECKSASNYAFRRAVLGELDYGKRCQLVSYARATQANIALIAYRSETAHLAEIAYVRGADRTRVVLTKPNGGQDVYSVDHKTERTPLVPEAGGEPQGFPADMLWETAEVQTPYDPTLEVEIDERVRRVLCGEMPTPRDVALPSGSYRLLNGLFREAGPSFLCQTCGGTGTQTMRKGQAVPLKTPKPCEECAGGMVNETELASFPCGYAIPPEMPILMADYSWKTASKLVPGDAIISATEEAPEERRDRRIEMATVVAVAPRRKDVITLSTAHGSVTSSPEHPWLMRLHSRQGGSMWREASRIRVGNFLYWLSNPVATDTENENFMGGYIRGLVDGDGCVQRRSDFPVVRVAMADVEPLERLTWYLQYFGLHATIEPFSAYRNRLMFQARFGGTHHDLDGVVQVLLEWPLYSHEAACGYLGGLYDAEGSLSRWSLRIHQVASSPVTQRVLMASELAGVDFDLERWRQGKRRHVGAVRLRSKDLTGALIRLFTKIRPALLRKAALNGRPLYNGWTKINAVASGPERDLVDIQTSSKTFVAGGFVSHNCPVVAACYPFARLEIDDRPHHRVTRADWEASGLGFVRPNGDSR